MKKILVVTLILLIAFTLVASGLTEQINVEKSQFKTEFHNYDGYYSTLIIVDQITGVNYLVIGKVDHQGGVTITPRLKADVKLYTSKISIRKD